MSRQRRGRPSNVERVMADVTANRMDGTFRLGRLTLRHGSGATEVAFVSIDGPSEMDPATVEQRVERAVRRFAADIVEAGMAGDAAFDGDSEAA